MVYFLSELCGRKSHFVQLYNLWQKIGHKTLNVTVASLSPMAAVTFWLNFGGFLRARKKHCYAMQSAAHLRKMYHAFVEYIVTTYYGLHIENSYHLYRSSSRLIRHQLQFVQFNEASQLTARKMRHATLNNQTARTRTQLPLNTLHVLDLMAAPASACT